MPYREGEKLSKKQYTSQVFIGILFLALITGFTMNKNRRTADAFIDDSVIASGIKAEITSIRC